MSKAPSVLFAAVLALAVAAGVALLFDAQPSPQQDTRAQEFHHLVGGLGFGPAVDLDRCEFGFDPRLCPACSNDLGPIPGGLFFCPLHACSTFDYQPLTPGHPPDARVP